MVPATPSTTPAARSSPASANPTWSCDRTPPTRSRRPSPSPPRPGMPIAVRSGGHGLLPVDDGLVVDLAEFTVDRGRATTGSSRSAAAPDWGDVAAALAPHGLGVSSGDTRDVGVGGLALGGGIGWLVRQQGLAIDALREVELVTAAGEVLTVNADAHPDALLGAPRRRRQLRRRHPVRVPGVARPTGSSAGTCTSTRPTCRRCSAPGATSCGPGPTSSTPRSCSCRRSPPRCPPARSSASPCRAARQRAARAARAAALAARRSPRSSLGPVAYGDLLEDAPPGRPPFLFVGGNGFVPDLSDEALDAIARAYAREVPTMVMLRALGGEFSPGRARRDGDRPPRRRGAAHRERRARRRRRARAGRGGEGGQRRRPRVHERHLRQLLGRARRRGHRGRCTRRRRSRSCAA